MGLFDIFRKKSPGDAMEEELLRLAPILFPGGPEQIQAAGRSISAMLDNRIPPEGAAQLYASTKYLAHTAEDKTKPRIVGYILRRGMGILSAEDASAIYDQFIVAASPNAAQQAPHPSTESPPNRLACHRCAAPMQPGFRYCTKCGCQLSNAAQQAPYPSADGAVFINANLGDREYTLTSREHSVRIKATLFTTIVLCLRSSGWPGAANLFDASGTAINVLPGSYPISEQDAKDIASSISGLLASRESNRKIVEDLAPLIAIASKGAFTIHA
ncbi:MAG: hypothetical protein HZB34_12880 [Nitrospirae bacterium]|nr:hypothetical protein [Nitrospirota bacterium]